MKRSRTEEEEDEAENLNNNLVVTITDPSLLDCPICCEPLTIPVFQCDQNGHIACSSCFTKINRCPSCSCTIGSKRCRAVEQILESIKIPCQNSKYGCNTLVPYNNRSSHKKEYCYFSPCSCPYLGCTFVSSVKELYKHFSDNHLEYATNFVFEDDVEMDSEVVSFTLTESDKFLVLREKGSGTLFVLYNDVVDVVGNAVRVSCIQPSFIKGFNYSLIVHHEEETSIFLSVTKSTPCRELTPNSIGLFIPTHFFDDLGANIQIRISSLPIMHI